MDCDSILDRARKLAEQAKPGFETIGGKLYTFDFDQNEWVYRVYEDGMLLVSFNTKKLATAKRYLRDWLGA